MQALFVCTSFLVAPRSGSDHFSVFRSQCRRLPYAQRRSNSSKSSLYATFLADDSISFFGTRIQRFRGAIISRNVLGRASIGATVPVVFALSMCGFVLRSRVFHA